MSFWCTRKAVIVRSSHYFHCHSQLEMPTSIWRNHLCWILSFFPDWVEGTKLSDRQRGWVPKSHLETIASSRVKRHNLSDALKLTAATAWPESGHYKGSNSVIWFRNFWIKDDGHSVTFLEDNAAAQNAIRLHLSVAVALVCFMCWNNVFTLLHEAAKWTAEDCQKGGVGIMVFICYAQYITNIVCTSVDLCFKKIFSYGNDFFPRNIIFGICIIFFVVIYGFWKMGPCVQERNHEMYHKRSARQFQDVQRGS